MVRSWLTAFSLLIATVAAQARRPCVGVAYDAEGKPVSGATLTCVYATPGDPQFANDRQVVTTDARGRFRVPLWCGVAYTSWLIGPPDAAGACAVSRLRQGATGGGYFVIETVGPARPRKLRLEGLSAWREHGAAKLRLHVSGSDAQGAVVPLDMESATCELPVLPASPIPFVLLDAKDVPLVFGLVPTDATASAALAPPVERVVTLAGDDDVLATAEVFVLLRIPEPWDNGEILVPAHRYLRRPAVAIDARRQARVVLPGPAADAHYYWFRAAMVAARAEGVAPVAVTTDTSGLEVVGTGGVDSSDTPQEQAQLQLALAKGPAVRLAGAVAGQRVLVIPQANRDGDYYRAAVPEVVTLDEPQPALRGSRHWHHVRVWQRGDDSSANALPLVASHTLDGAEGDVVAAQGTVTARIRVLDVDRGPGREAWVAVLREGARHRVGGLDMWCRADSGGAVTLELPPGRYGIYATDGVGLGKGELELVGGSEQRSVVSLELERLPRLRCVVHDKQGTPVAGARVHTMKHGDRPAGLGAIDTQHFDVAQELAYRLAVRDVTDGRGRIDLPIIPLVSNNATLMFRRPDGGMTGEVAMRGTEEPVNVR